MRKHLVYSCLGLLSICLGIISCKVPQVVQATENRSTPQSFNDKTDTVNTATIQWRKFFTDPNLQNLIDSALKRNQELNITLQEIEIARNEIRFRQAPLFP